MTFSVQYIVSDNFDGQKLFIIISLVTFVHVVKFVFCLIYTACIVMRQGLCNGTMSVRLSIRLSVCPIYRLLQQRVAAVGPASNDTDRLLHGASAAVTSAFWSISAAARPVAARCQLT